MTGNVIDMERPVGGRHFHDRIAAWMRRQKQASGKSWGDYARESQRPCQTGELTRIVVKRERDFTFDRLQQFAPAFGTTAEDLIQIGANPPKWHNYVAVPLHDVRQFHGPGDHLYRGEEPMLLFHRAWMREHFTAPAGLMTLFLVADDAMATTFAPGDVLVVDKQRRSPEEDGLYALRLDGRDVVRRLVADGERVTIIRDNPIYASRREIKSSEVDIIGHIVWRSTPIA